MIKGVWESVRLGPTITRRVGSWLGELVGGLWFVKIGGGTMRWFVVYTGNGVEDRSMVAHDKENG
jgi:hypothetical protein